MSTAIGICRIPQNPAGGDPSRRLRFHGPPPWNIGSWLLPGSPDPGWRGPRGPRLLSVTLGTHLQKGPLEPTKGTPPWLAVWILSQRIQKGSGMCTAGTRSRVSLEPRRRGDCFSRPTAGAAAFCSSAAGTRQHRAVSPAGSRCTPGCMHPGVPQGTVPGPPGTGTPPPRITPPSDRRRRADGLQAIEHEA